MPLKGYGVLKGKAIDARREDNQSSPHYQVHVLAAGTHYRLAVNVKSVAMPSELMFLVNDNFQHPITAHLERSPGRVSPRWRARRAGRRWISSAATCSTIWTCGPFPHPARARQRPQRPARALRHARDPGARRQDLHLRPALGAGADDQGQDLRLPARATGFTTST